LKFYWVSEYPLLLKLRWTDSVSSEHRKLYFKKLTTITIRGIQSEIINLKSEIFNNLPDNNDGAESKAVISIDVKAAFFQRT